MDGEVIKSIILGASKFWSIIFSNPLPIEITKKRDGIIPIRVDQKKLYIFTLKIHGKTFCIWNGIPPTNLKINKYINSDFLNFSSRLLNRFKNFSLIISFKK